MRDAKLILMSIYHYSLRLYENRRGDKVESMLVWLYTDKDPPFFKIIKADDETREEGRSIRCTKVIKKN